MHTVLPLETVIVFVQSLLFSVFTCRLLLIVIIRPPFDLLVISLEFFMSSLWLSLLQSYLVISVPCEPMPFRDDTNAPSALSGKNKRFGCLIKKWGRQFFLAVLLKFISQLTLSLNKTDHTVTNSLLIMKLPVCYLPLMRKYSTDYTLEVLYILLWSIVQRCSEVI